MNKLYPGLPNYKGKTKGYFTCLHHKDNIIEWSDDVMERVEYINENKPEDERKIRLNHIVYVPDKIVPRDFVVAMEKWNVAEKKLIATREKWYAAKKKLNVAEKKRRVAWKEWNAAEKKWYAAREKWYAAMEKWDVAREKLNKSKTLLNYLRKHVEDCRWLDGKLHTRILSPKSE